MRKGRVSSAGAALRSAIVPGWGQIATNRPTMGRILLFISGLLVVFALAAFLFVPPVEIAAWLADPEVLLMVIVVNVMIGLIRLGSTQLAWIDGGGRSWMVTIALAVIVAVPHVAIGWAGFEARNSLLTVFAQPEPEAVTVSVKPSTTTTTTTAPIELSPIITIPGQYDEDPINATKAPPWRPFGEDRLNILLLGADAGPGRGGLRTDTVMVASIDPVTGDAALLGLPRNYGGLTFTDGEPIPVRRLNHVYGWGDRNPDAYGGLDPGASAVRNAVENITGLAIDHFVMVDLTGFAEVIDVFGGVTLKVSSQVDGPLYDVNTGLYEMVTIEPGTRHLDGDHALAYARARYGSSDYARMGRQRCILTSLVSQNDPLSILANLGHVLTVIEENITTDLPVDMVPDLIRLMFRVSGEEIRMIGFDSSWAAGWTDDGHAIPDIQRIRDAVRSLIEEQDAEVVTGIGIAGETCT